MHLHVAMLLRPDADVVHGGDTVHMRQLATSLEEVGVRVRLVTLADLVKETRTVDVLHVFNLAPLEYIRDAMAWAARNRIPTILTPLHYVPLRHWFSEAVARSKKWSTVSRLLGPERTWPLYAWWHRKRRAAWRVWRLEREILSNATLIATNARSENRYLVEHYRLGTDVASRMRCYPVGIDAERYSEYPSDGAVTAFEKAHGFRRPVVQVARIEPHKNQLALIQALFADPIDIAFVGRSTTSGDAYAEECRRLADRRGRVHFIDWLPDAELPLLYAAASVHALPSWWDLPGLVNLEAAAMGCKVVSTAVGSAHEYLGDLAWYCEPADVDSIRRAIHSALAAKPNGQLRARVRSAYTWRRSAQEAREIYQAALPDGTSPMAATRGVRHR
jgi:glycosyltransferase involved in cell wall biosynthesis